MVMIKTTLIWISQLQSLLSFFITYTAATEEQASTIQVFSHQPLGIISTTNKHQVSLIKCDYILLIIKLFNGSIWCSNSSLLQSESRYIIPTQSTIIRIGRVRARFSNEMPLKLNIKNAFDQTKIGMFSKYINYASHFGFYR
jgi:hypothetical protein